MNFFGVVEFLFVVFCSYQVGSVGCEVGGSLRPKAALLAVLLRPQVSKRPIEVAGSAPGHGKADSSTLLVLLVGYS